MTEIRIKFPIEALDFIESLEGFESHCLYPLTGRMRNPHEWGRIRHNEKIIYFDYIPSKKKNIECACCRFLEKLKGVLNDLD